MLRARLDTSGSGASTHFVVYTFVPDVLSQHPLFGLGLNNFSVYYEFVTGRTNFGPHSFYVALLVETGIVGFLLFAAFVGVPVPPAGRGAPIWDARWPRPATSSRRPACGRSSGG